MTDQLFDKALVIADLHFGRSGNSPVANTDNLEFLAWAIDEARTFGAKTCVMLGDWHDNRHSIGIGTILASLDGMDMLNDAFERIWWLPGNHDLQKRDSRDAASIEFARWLPHVHIVRQPTNIGDVCFLPWLVQNEHKTIKPEGRYVFGHLELPGFLMNAKVEMKESDHAPTADQFSAHDWVYTGHFHMRQSKRNVCYTGNVMPFNFSDDWDDDRGAMFLQWGKDPLFKAWPQQPLYRSLKLSDLLDKTDMLKPRMTLRVEVDIPLRYEEAQEIRDSLVASYGLRKLEMRHKREDVDQTFQTDVQFRTVDEIVVSGLQSVQSVELDPGRLVEIYQSL